MYLRDTACRNWYFLYNFFIQGLKYFYITAPNRTFLFYTDFIAPKYETWIFCNCFKVTLGNFCNVEVKDKSNDGKAEPLNFSHLHKTNFTNKFISNLMIGWKLYFAAL